MTSNTVKGSATCDSVATSGFLELRTSTSKMFIHTIINIMYKLTVFFEIVVLYSLTIVNREHDGLNRNMDEGER